jgi:hypothetical protein
VDSNQVIGWIFVGLILLIVAYAVLRISSTKFKDLPPARRMVRSLEYLLWSFAACALCVGVVVFMGSSSLGTGLLLALALVAVVAIMLRSPKADTKAAHFNAKFRIARNGEDLGDLDLPSVKLMLKDGRLTLDDYYFEPSVGDWLPIRSNKHLG